MEPIRNHFEQQQAPVAGIAKDLHSAKTHGAASAAELRQFIGQLQGRSPQEVMGVVAQSSLVRSIALATFGWGIALLALTIPFAIRNQLQPEVAAQPATTSETATPVEADTTAAGEPAGTPQAGSADNLKAAAAAMGIDEAVSPDSDTKPLDDKLDKLLDGID